MGFTAWLVCLSAALAPPTELAGLFEGTLTAGPVKLRLLFTFTPPTAADQPLTASMVSIDQGPDALPFDTVIVKDRGVKLRLKAVGATFAGTLSEDGTTLEGKWMQSGATFPLKLQKVEKPTELKRPQEPKPPFPYDSRDVSFENASAKVTLAGTLTTPRGAEPLAAVVLVSGSGPQDRDETLFQHKPFWVLADRLTRDGVAVLRYDDRGVGKSTGKQAGATSVDFALDALAAIEFVMAETKLPAAKVGIIGHSEGGLIGPMLAADHPEQVGFVVILAGPGLPGAEVIVDQGLAIMKLAEISPAALAARETFSRSVFALVKTDLTGAKLTAEVTRLATEAGEKLSETERKLVGVDVPGTLAFVGLFADPWMRAFLQSDPEPILKRVRQPVLALFGEKDVQVSAAANAAAVRKACPHATVEIRSGLNHLFQPAKTGGVDEYAQIEITLDPATLDRVSEWVRTVAKDAK